MMSSHLHAQKLAEVRHFYEAVTTQWVQQTRAYVRSLRMYQESRSDSPRRLVHGTVTISRSARLTMEPGPVHTNGTAAAASAPPSPDATKGPLTPRQLEIAELIARGLSNEEIAQELVLTPGTVGNHVGHMLRRLGARNRAQVASWITTRAAVRDDPGQARTS